MCGIVAVIGDAQLTAAVLDRMRDSLAHRGPDGARSWLSNTDSASVGLGHRRLSIIDLTHGGDQPMRSESDAMIVFNGEIYNYVELREELRACGHRFKTSSDTEVLLAAYDQWDVQCLERLNGMFAFAIWDPRRGHVFAARDRFGEKPLFHAEIGGGGLAIGSEVKSLLAHPRIVARPNAEAVSVFLAGPYYESDELTLFAGVRRLPPAHAMTIDTGGRILRQWRYWTPDFTVRDDSYREADAVEQFASMMERSVAMRLRSDVPVGSSLSGGLDSSTIVCLIAKLRRAGHNATQNTFSGRFDDDPTLSEGPYIDMVVKATGASAYSVSPDPKSLIDESAALHYHQEEPFLSASIYLQWCVNRLAAEHGTTVILDGQGADEILGGYQFYFPTHQLDLLETGQRARALWETWAFSRRLRTASRRYPDARRRFNSDVAIPLREMLKLTRGHISAPTGPNRGGVPASPGGRFRSLRAEAVVYHTLPQLLRYADRNSMAFGRETRLPFLDHNLVEWVARLPDRALVSNGWQKLLLRRAGRGLLPHRVAWRADKMGYAAPLDRWLRRELKTWAYDRLTTGPITQLDEYDRAALDALWDEHQAGAAEHSWALWKWISLNEWLALFENGLWTRANDRPDRRQLATQRRSLTIGTD